MERMIKQGFSDLALEKIREIEKAKQIYYILNELTLGKSKPIIASLKHNLN
jgi:hypothetical protein